VNGNHRDNTRTISTFTKTLTAPPFLTFHRIYSVTFNNLCIRHRILIVLRTNNDQHKYGARPTSGTGALCWNRDLTTFAPVYWDCRQHPRLHGVSSGQRQYGCDRQLQILHRILQIMGSILLQEGGYPIWVFRCVSQCVAHMLVYKRSAFIKIAHCHCLAKRSRSRTVFVVTWRNTLCSVTLRVWYLHVRSFLNFPIQTLTSLHQTQCSDTTTARRPLH
jgi:hypothetical protein